MSVNLLLWITCVKNATFCVCSSGYKNSLSVLVCHIQPAVLFRPLC